MAGETPIRSVGDLPPEIRNLQISNQELMVATARMAQEIGALKEQIGVITQILNKMADQDILRNRIVNSLQDQVKILSGKD